MLSLIDRVDGAVEQMLADVATFIFTCGIEDMHQCADTITTVSYSALGRQRWRRRLLLTRVFHGLLAT